MSKSPMTEDLLATALTGWADGLAPTTRGRLSTYDLRALYDRLAARGPHDPEPSDAAGWNARIERWAKQLGPRTQAALSSYDRRALVQLLIRPRSTPAPPGPSPMALGPPTHPEGARSRGFTGGSCSVCGSLAVVQSGTCATCQDCGATTGCA